MYNNNERVTLIPHLGRQRHTPLIFSFHICVNFLSTPQIYHVLEAINVTILQFINQFDYLLILTENLEMSVNRRGIY